jgi:hypothetical protein
MKICSVCSRPYPDALTTCLIDGSALGDPRPYAMPMNPPMPGAAMSEKPADLPAPKETVAAANVRPLGLLIVVGLVAIAVVIALVIILG